MLQIRAWQNYPLTDGHGACNLPVAMTLLVSLCLLLFLKEIRNCLRGICVRVSLPTSQGMEKPGSQNCGNEAQAAVAMSFK